MNLAAVVRSGLLGVAVLALAETGCNEATSTNPTTINETPPKVLTPTAPDEPKPEAARTTTTAEASKEATKTKTEAPADSKDATPAQTDDSAEPKKEGAAGASASAAAGDVKLEKITFDEMLKQIAAKKAKLTMVDAWATWCGPCKENFPHVVEMNQKYAGMGLNVVSLSLDDSSDDKAIAEATAFLQSKGATFTNIVLAEEPAAAFDKLNVSTIPAVFLYGPDGKEIRRFTMDDPDNQFTYDQVEKTVAAMLKGESVPETKKASAGE